jgi:hypothetical protein
MSELHNQQYRVWEFSDGVMWIVASAEEEARRIWEDEFDGEPDDEIAETDLTARTTYYERLCGEHVNGEILDDVSFADLILYLESRGMRFPGQLMVGSEFC